MTDIVEKNMKIALYKKSSCNIFFKVIVAVALKFLFEYSYIRFYSDFFGYMGTTVSINWTKCVISWIVLAFFLLLNVGMPDDYRVWLPKMFLYMSVIPTISIFWIKDQSSDAFMLICLYWLIFYLSYNILLYKYLHDSYVIGGADNVDLNDSNFVCLVWYVVLIVTIAFSAIYGAGRLFVRFEDVYVYRLDASNYMGTVESYIFSWNSNFFLPVYLIIHLSSKKYIKGLVDVFLMLVSYAIYGNKFTFFMIIACLGIVVLEKLKRINFLPEMVGLILVIFMLLSIMLNDRMLFAIGDRLLEIPAALQYHYYDFFSSNEKLYLRESILRFIFDAPYDPISSVQIGSSPKYFTGTYNNANNGLFSIAYANFGIIGVVVQPVLISLVCICMLGIMNGIDKKIIAIIAISSMMCLLSAGSLQWLMTGGVIVGMIFIYLGKTRRFDFVLEKS